MSTTPSTTTTADAPWKRYVGDGVYADFDGYAIVLTTENGIEVTNRIVLESAVWTALKEYASWLRKAARDAR